MARLVVVFSIVGLMLADPILCRAEAWALPCSGTCRAWHEASASHPEPVEPGHDSAHGCLCQGATQTASERFVPLSEAGGFDPGLPLGGTTRPACPAAGTDARGRGGAFARTQGRRIRIEMQSFLI